MIFSLSAMDRAGHKFDGRIVRVSPFNDQVDFRAIGNLYKQFVCRPSRKYVRNAMMEFGKKSDDSDNTDGESTCDGKIANATVLSPGRVMFIHLNACVLKSAPESRWSISEHPLVAL